MILSSVLYKFPLLIGCSLLCICLFVYLIGLVFYDIGSSKARNNKELKINMNFNTKSVSTRLWEIRITQIPFSSRAPSGCMQYFTGNEGKY